MKTFEVRRAIAASPETVWARLTDARALVSGGLGVERVDGTIAPGEGLKVTSEADLQPSFEQFADGLCRLAEGRAQ